jgi:hypothetical protein
VLRSALSRVTTSAVTTSRRLLLAALALVFVILVLGLEYRARSGHLEQGVGRIDSYAATDDPRRIVIHYATGHGDQVIGPTLMEDAKSVTVAVRISVWVPGRDTFKQASATLLEVPVTLNAPLGDRTVIDRETGTRVPRAAP